MYTLVFVGLIVVALTWLRLRWMRVRSYWKNAGVQYKPPHPILGSLTFLQKMNMMEWLRGEYLNFSDHPYFGIWLFWRPALVVRDRQLARNILVKDFDVFRNRFVSSGETDPIGGLNIFTVNDPIWSSVRRRLTHVFTAAKLRAMNPLVVGKAKELVERIRKDYVLDKKPMSLRDLYADYTTDIIGAAAFGVAGDATLTGHSTMRSITRVFASYSLQRGLEFSSIFFYPQLCDFFRIKFFTRKTTEFFREVFRKIVAQRGGWDANIGESRDLLDALIRLKQEFEADGEEITEDTIIAQAAIFVQGGFDTSAVALTFGTYELAFLPHVQDKLYAELSDAKLKSGGELDPNVLSDLPYLGCIIKETLRKYPAMGFLDRIAAADYRVDDKLTVKKGTPVYVCAIGLHYDPEFYPDPYKFDPERFSENERFIKPFTFMPFGEGPRNCIGLRFAYQTLRNAIANIVLTYKIQPLPGAVRPEEVHFDPHGIFMAPAIPLSVEFIPRN